MFNQFETAEAHLYETMCSDDVSMSLRITIAHLLMHSACGQLRSKAYWWMQKPIEEKQKPHYPSYNANCPLCLRGLPHSDENHEHAIARALAIYGR